MSNTQLHTQSQLLDAVKMFVADNLDESFSAEDLFDALNDGETDFEIEGVRFISETTIDDVLSGEIFSDEYILGCYAEWFLSENTPLPRAAIAAMQECEAFEALGKTLCALMDNAARIKFAQEAASVDSYGHHFNGYDGSELELQFGGEMFHVFKTEG